MEGKSGHKGEQPGLWYTEAKGRMCFKDWTEFHLQHKGRVDTLSNSRENKNKVNAGTLKLHLGGSYQTKKEKDQKVKNLTEDLHKIKLWPLSVRVNEVRT